MVKEVRDFIGNRSLREMYGNRNKIVAGGAIFLLGAALLGVPTSQAAQVSPTPLQHNTTTVQPGLTTPSPYVTPGNGSSQLVFADNLFRLDCTVTDSTSAWTVTWDGSTPTSTNGTHLNAGDIFKCSAGVGVVAGKIQILAVNNDVVYGEEEVARGQ